MGSVARNSAVSGPVSVNVRVSVSPVTSFRTTTCTVSTAREFSSRSASSTLTVNVSPGTLESVMSMVPSVPIGVVSRSASSSSPLPKPLPGVESGSVVLAVAISAALTWSPVALTVAVMFSVSALPATTVPTVQTPLPLS